MTSTAAVDPTRKSWVESANQATSDFPIQNLPFGVFSADGEEGSGRVGIAIGDSILDVTAALAAGLISDDAKVAAVGCSSPRLNEVMSLGRSEARALRSAVAELLDPGTTVGRRAVRVRDKILVAMEDVVLHLPAEIGDYSDFYASIDHASNVGGMFRPENPLLPNYKYVPIGYHGRASSIVPTGSFIQRPSGQTRDDPAAPPTFGPSRRLDYEMEVGAFVGAGNSLGQPIAIDAAEEHIFGLCLVNDWSARDLQTWEYQPLGPFLSKSFATTVSPWVVTLDALEPFRRPAYARPPGDPAPLPYLSSESNASRGGIDITLDVLIQSAQMRDVDAAPMLISRGRFTTMYWTVAQLVTHHASNGCNLRPGDLLASGTVSGPTPDSRGCLLERTRRGTEPLTLPTGERRTFIEKDDEIIMRGYCERDGAVRIGFGECSGVVVDDDMIFWVAGTMEADAKGPVTERSKLRAATDWLRRRTRRRA